MPKRRKLDAAEWSRVFQIRIRSKRGEHVTPDDLLLCERALAEDGERYKAMEPDVFDATVPFGSSVKAKR